MSRRFKASKYKNAAPKISKHDSWVRDLIVGSYNCSGNYIKCSGAFIAFNVQPTGSQLGVVPLDPESTVNGTTLSVINAHSDLVTDLDFSPFEDGLLATCSADSTVKVWALSPDKIDDLSTLSPECVTSSKHRRVEIVTFNPVAEYMLTYAAQSSLTLWDILYNRDIFHDNELHGDTIMSVSWNKAGNLLASCAKDKLIRIVDPRARQVVTSATSHDNAKDTRVQWLGDSPYILTTGFDSSRIRQIFIRDSRQFASPVKSVNFDSSTGILMPLYDADTNMLFVAGRGDSSINYMEFSETEPFLTEGFRYNGEQTKGACLLPKRALRVMETEVNRVIQLTASSLISIPYHVPRKTYVDFHADLYPDTRGTVTSGTASLWMDGFNGAVTKISLNPSTKSVSGPVFKPSLASRKKEEEAKISRMIEHEPDKYKIPEPRPRKKSISSGSSSSEEVQDAITSRLVPVPRPRVNNASQAGVSVLRTPSSFLTKRSSGSDYPRSLSMDESESVGLNQYAVQADNNAANSLNNNHEAQRHENGTNGVVEHHHHENGNEKLDILDGNQLSTSDRRKAFEARSFSVPVAVPSEVPSANVNRETRKPRMTVADRLKMFQQNVEEIQEETRNAPLQVPTANNNKDIKSDNTSAERQDQSHSVQAKIPEFEKTAAPIPKPERKGFIKSDANLNHSKLPEGSTNVPAPKTTKRIDTVFGQVSKFRNFKASPLHKKFHIENLRNISTTCPGESELIQGNPERVAVPLNTTGGKIAIFEISKPGRQPDGVIPALVHPNKIMDFAWDPFDNQRLCSGTDDGRIWLWRIPVGGLTEQTNKPEWSTSAHLEKIYFVRFHPLTQDVLATGSYDLSIRIWDLAIQQDVIILHFPAEQIQLFSFAWSPCGSKFVTACKDGKIRVYEPRKGNQPLATGKGPAGVRGGRVTWVLDGKFLIVAGFDRSSERQLLMYDADTLENVATVSLDVSPAILVPFYDEDSSILFLSGRGDSTIFAFDVMSYSPHMRQLSHHRCPGAHHGICFLKKNACDVQNVEFARALRLTEVSVEIWSFTVPRVKSEFFQDDLFPPTKVLWEPTMSSREWFSGSNDETYRISLKPPNMRVFQETVPESANVSRPSSSEQEKPKDVSVTSLGPNFNNTEAARRQQKRVEQALREKFNVNFEIGQELLQEVDETDWNE